MKQITRWVLDTDSESYFDDKWKLDCALHGDTMALVLWEIVNQILRTKHEVDGVKADIKDDIRQEVVNLLNDRNIMGIVDGVS